MVIGSSAASRRDDGRGRFLRVCVGRVDDDDDDAAALAMGVLRGDPRRRSSWTAGLDLLWSVRLME